MPRIARETEQLVDLCESPFERDVFLRLVSMGYRVTPQVEVGSFRIDLVVEGENDKRLGVELDGDSHHGPDKWLEDWSRQRIMERDGWRFWRCWYSSFIMDPEGCMQELVEVLEEMRIKPIGAGAGQQPYTHHRVVSAPAAKIEVAVDKESEVTAEIGDSLIIAFNDEPSRNRLIRLTDKQSDLVDGIVSVDDPAGKALLHKSVEDEVELLWDGKSRAATILQIEKVLAGVS